ncbi:DsrE family protein [Ancylomarina longa]|uniref:DsrE family protein n=1 Tax=Ancylomarina longa TaxID=2487017 RepID=A0A434B078_9BACT|nr:DsrE family protein [Ancylomarina longa]RUT80117.1 DsrE family protein [Ancylomarina longa]
MLQKESKKLVVLWTSGDREIALKMVYPYTYNSIKMNWWEEVTFIIWGSSTKLLSEDTELQAYIARMKEIGIRLETCKFCADSYGVSDILDKLGIEVKYMGEPLTEYLQNDYKVITF